MRNENGHHVLPDAGTNFLRGQNGPVRSPRSSAGVYGKQRRVARPPFPRQERRWSIWGVAAVDSPSRRLQTETIGRKKRAKPVPNSTSTRGVAVNRFGALAYESP
jgi:hypothetical protein